MNETTETKILTQQYLHISNGGVTFSVCDSGCGPEFVVESSSFGNAENKFTLRVTKSNLTALGNMLLDAALLNFSPDYCNATAETRTVVKPADHESDDKSVHIRIQAIDAQSLTDRSHIITDAINQAIEEGHQIRQTIGTLINPH